MRFDVVVGRGSSHGGGCTIVSRAVGVEESSRVSLTTVISCTMCSSTLVSDTEIGKGKVSVSTVARCHKISNAFRVHFR